MQAAARAMSLSQLSSSSTPTCLLSSGPGGESCADLTQMTACRRSLDEGLGSQSLEAQWWGEPGTRTVMAQSAQSPEPSQVRALSAARFPAQSTCSSRGPRAAQRPDDHQRLPHAPGLGRKARPVRPPATPLRRRSPSGERQSAAGIWLLGLQAARPRLQRPPGSPAPANRARTHQCRAAGEARSSTTSASPSESSHTVHLADGSDSAGLQRCSGLRRARAPGGGAGTATGLSPRPAARGHAHAGSTPAPATRGTSLWALDASTPVGSAPLASLPLASSRPAGREGSDPPPRSRRRPPPPPRTRKPDVRPTWRLPAGAGACDSTSARPRPTAAAPHARPRPPDGRPAPPRPAPRSGSRAGAEQGRRRTLAAAQTPQSSDSGSASNFPPWRPGSSEPRRAPGTPPRRPAALPPGSGLRAPPAAPRPPRSRAPSPAAGRANRGRRLLRSRLRTVPAGAKVPPSGASSPRRPATAAAPGPRPPSCPGRRPPRSERLRSATPVPEETPLARPARSAPAPRPRPAPPAARPAAPTAAPARPPGRPTHPMSQSMAARGPPPDTLGPQPAAAAAAGSKHSLAHSHTRAASAAGSDAPRAACREA